MSINPAPPSSAAAEPPLLCVCGDLDRTSYLDLVAASERLHAAGAVALRIDLSRATGISLSGLVGLFAIAELFDGRPLPDFECGWWVIRRLREPAPTRTGPPPVALTGMTERVRETLARARLLPRFRVSEPALSPVPIATDLPGGGRRVRVRRVRVRHEPAAAARHA